jgi:hypothetical protein
VNLGPSSENKLGRSGLQMQSWEGTCDNDIFFECEQISQCRFECGTVADLICLWIDDPDCFEAHNDNGWVFRLSIESDSLDAIYGDVDMVLN